MFLDDDKYSAGDVITITVSNMGSESVYIRASYKIYALKNGIWKPYLDTSINLDNGTIFKVEPSKNFMQKFNLKGFPEGDYKIEKIIYLNSDLTEEMVLTAYFQVV